MPTQIGPIAVAASADDASELATTVVSITANPLDNCDTTGVWNAWRFTGITIPAGASIVSAFLTVNFTSATLDEPDVTIYGLDTASPAAFQAVNGDISGRARTTASVDWSNPNAGSQDVDTSDLSTIVAELLASYTYNNGVIGLLAYGGDSATANNVDMRRYGDDVDELPPPNPKPCTMEVSN